ncbi:hypothetical protein KZP23_16835 [Echinicola marina]|uniref:hypothetical protein n=1 Tax=Echinicola marina TaxID=2859768 RepID=UPI001CF6F0C2|nr:hypothetical protein [Echinicola marina]UCS92355.1 hypothetical protein KZP23_16835 [Echinicola marina]
MKNTVPKETAKKWMKKWKNMEKDYNKKTPVNGFLIPLIDLQEVMAEPGVTNVRTYIGIDDNDMEKLLIVGVDENGNDMIDEAKGQSIYDFTQPCPPMCGEMAPDGLLSI